MEEVPYPEVISAEGRKLQETPGHCLLYTSLSGAKKIAVAGGVTLGMVPVLKSCGIEIGIVGSAITKSENKHEMTARFAEAVRG